VDREKRYRLADSWPIVCCPDHRVQSGRSVERFLDRAFLAGLPRIRIVHGTGMGVLRRTLRDYLRNHPHVASVTEPPQNQGGQGATEVEIEAVDRVRQGDSPSPYLNDAKISK